MNTPRSSTSGRRKAAFTLLEVVLVITIIIILIGLLAVGLTGARQQAVHRATQGRIARLEVAIQRFYDQFRVYPPDEWGDIGSVDSATADTLTDNSKSWTNNEWIGAMVGVDTDGDTTLDEIRSIIDNDADTLRVDPPWGTTPSLADNYYIGMVMFLVNHGYDANDITTSPDKTYQDIECLVYALTVVRTFFELKEAERFNKEATPDEIDWQNADTMDSPAYEICDAWGNALHYVTYVAVADSGTITSVAATSLTDSTKSWVVNRWVDWKVSAGEQVRTITSNTSDTLTISPAWSPQPAVGSLYKIEFLPLHNPGFVDIWSNGPDGVSGTDDDVTNWERH